jgi:thiosulfate reductase cytochrome b subunit
MRNITFVILILLIALPSSSVWAQANLTAEENQAKETELVEPVQGDAAKPTANQVLEFDPQRARRVNPIHPLFPVLDADGASILTSGKSANTTTTCGACHDVAFIRRHNSHVTAEHEVDCLVCHTPDKRLPADAASYDEQGRIKREQLFIQSPGVQECGACHGVVHAGETPLTLPDSFRNAAPKDDLHPLHLTRETGAIFSGQNMDMSYLNISQKHASAFPWDIHAARLVSCSACHYAPNNPAHVSKVKDAPRHLIQDPRKLSTADYLVRPDHQLLASDCRTCHDPLATHDFLPYKQRHFERMACQACHIPQVKAPVLESVDMTVAMPDGNPRMVWRNMEDDNHKTVNARYTTSFEPFLFPYQQDLKGPVRILPVNIVTQWEWIDGESGLKVDFTLVKQAFSDWTLEDWAQARAHLDTDNDGQISASEWLLKDSGSVAWIAERLKVQGVREPKVAGVSKLIPINHGIQANVSVIRECTTCHGAASRFAVNPPIDNALVADITPTLVSKDGRDYLLAAGTIIGKNSDARLYRSKASQGYYLLGHDRAPWSDTLGLLFFVITALGVAGHAARRVYTSKLRNGRHAETKMVYIYTAYERLWHWLMAASIILLLVTGFEIHYISSFTLFGFANAVNIHNVLAAIMIVNAFLSLFYHVASRHIRQFIPKRETFLEDVIEQAKFYLHGIFVGAPHPGTKSIRSKLNPLQQITYMGLLNVLIPLQVLTGLLIWGVSQSTGLSDAIGGLSIVVPLHNLGSWLLLSFVTAHLYLITTGHTLASNLRAMVDGYDVIEVEQPSA